MASDTGRRTGFTLVEVLVAAGLLALLLAFCTRGIQYAARSLGLQERLEWATRLRNASYVLSRDLSLASEVIHPAGVTQEFSPHLIFKNQRNEIVGIFLSPDGLMHYNYNTDQARNLFPFAASFSCRLSQDNLLEFVLTVRKDKVEFSVRNQLSMYETLP